MIAVMLAILVGMALRSYAYPWLSIMVGMVTLALVRVISLCQHMQDARQSMPFMSSVIQDVLQTITNSNNVSHHQQQQLAGVL